MQGGDIAGFVARGTSLEPVDAELGTNVTPLDRFFVCKVGDVPSIDAATWRMGVDGDGVRSELSLSHGDLAGLPQRRVESWLECAGNGRSLFGLVGGRPIVPEANDTPWMLGAMGMGTWEGPTLRSILDLAGLAPRAAWVSPAGADVPNSEGEPVRMCMPIAKAQQVDTIVAIRMNGRPLEPAHGYPARLLVPGWIGAYSVKWLDRIEVSAAWISSWRADDYYRLRSSDGVDLGPATAHPVKSSLALPWPARMTKGLREVHGYARAAGQPVGRVEWRVDDGEWRDAELTGPNGDWTWSPFRFTWEATPGQHTISTRATAANGTRQPDTMRFHRDGIMWNAVIPHPIVVA